jgi:hypothetical protein
VEARRLFAADDDIVAHLNPHMGLERSVGLARPVAEDRGYSAAPEHELQGQALLNADNAPRCGIARPLHGPDAVRDGFAQIAAFDGYRDRSQDNGFRKREELQREAHVGEQPGSSERLLPFS